MTAFANKSPFLLIAALIASLLGSCFNPEFLDGFLCKKGVKGCPSGFTCCGGECLKSCPDASTPVDLSPDRVVPDSSPDQVVPDSSPPDQVVLDKGPAGPCQDHETVTTVKIALGADRTDLTLNSSGIPTLAFIDAATNQVAVISKLKASGKGWSSPVAFKGPKVDRVALAYDNKNVLYALFAQTPPASSEFLLHWSYLSGSAWKHPEPVGDNKKPEKGFVTSSLDITGGRPAGSTLYLVATGLTGPLASRVPANLFATITTGSSPALTELQRNLRTKSSDPFSHARVALGKNGAVARGSYYDAATKLWGVAEMDKSPMTIGGYPPGSGNSQDAPLVLAVDSKGTVYVVRATSASGKLSDLDHDVLGASGKKPPIVGGNNVDSASVDVTLDDAGAPCVSYLRASSPSGSAMAVYVSCLVGTTWKQSVKAIDNLPMDSSKTSSYAGYSTHVRYDTKLKKLHVAYQVDTGTSAQLRYALCEKPK